MRSFSSVVLTDLCRSFSGDVRADERRHDRGGHGRTSSSCRKCLTCSHECRSRDGSGRDGGSSWRSAEGQRTQGRHAEAREQERHVLGRNPTWWRPDRARCDVGRTEPRHAHQSAPERTARHSQLWSVCDCRCHCKPLLRNDDAVLLCLSRCFKSDRLIRRRPRLTHPQERSASRLLRRQ